MKNKIFFLFFAVLFWSPASMAAKDQSCENKAITNKVENERAYIIDCICFQKTNALRQSSSTESLIRASSEYSECLYQSVLRLADEYFAATPNLISEFKDDFKGTAPIFGKMVGNIILYEPICQPLDCGGINHADAAQANVFYYRHLINLMTAGLAEKNKSRKD
ncbi:MAG: hypothetical protein AB7G80_04815 [Dongiaceae bacterium]